jgi:hypothetical protein
LGAAGFGYSDTAGFVVAEGAGLTVALGTAGFFCGSGFAGGGFTVALGTIGFFGKSGFCCSVGATGVSLYFCGDARDGFIAAFYTDVASAGFGAVSVVVGTVGFLGAVGTAGFGGTLLFSSV